MNYDTLETFALSQELSDFKLLLPQKLNSLELFTHKIILVANSIFFKELFEKEKDLQNFELSLPQSSVKGPVTESIFKAVLKFGYQNQTVDKLIEAGLSEENAFRYFSVAKQLDFKTAQSIISEYIEQRNFQEDRFLETLFESIRFDQQNWVFSLIQKISQIFDRYIQNLDHREELLKLPFESFKALLSRDDLYVNDEDCVYKLVIDYIKFREELEEKQTQKNDSDQNKIDNDKKQENDSDQNQKQEKNQEENQIENEPLKNYKLNNQQKKELLNLVRLSYVSHSTLMESVQEKILAEFIDLILEAISAKLSQHENSNTNYSIILKPRNSYNKNQKTIQKQKQIQQPDQQSTIKIQQQEDQLEFTPKKEDALESLKEYETIQSNFLDNSIKKERMKKIEFIYSYNLDENGALYWLGSKGRTKPYKNPYQIGQVKVFFSSISENSLYDYFVGRKIENCRTSNQQDSYMGVDFGEKRLLVPKQYTIRNRDSLKHVCLNWALESSLDYKTWYEIDKRINLSNNEELNKQRKRERNALMQKGALTTWAVDLKKLKQIAEQLGGDIRSFKGFRFFRIKQIDKNSSDHYNLVLSGFEIYGTGYGEWFFDKEQLYQNQTLFCEFFIMNELNFGLIDSEKNLVFEISVKKLLDQKNVLEEYYDQILNLTLSASFILRGEEYKTNFRFLQSRKLEKIMEFNLKQNVEIDKLPLDSQLSFSLILNESLPQETYLGTTTFNLFDEKLRLRRGEFLLILWPFVSPHYEDINYSPGEIDEIFYQKIKENYFASIIQDQNLSKFHQSKSLESCLNQNFLLNQTVPLMFLHVSIQFPEQTTQIVLMDHPQLNITEKEQHITNIEVKNVNHPTYKFHVDQNLYNYLFRQTNQHSHFFQVRDNFHDFEKEDPILQMYLVNFDDENVKNLIPSQAQQEYLEEVIQRPNFYHFSPEEKADLWKFRYYLKNLKYALPKFLISVNWMINKNIDIALEFMNDWAVVDKDDALFLLSKQFSANDIYTSELQISPKRKIQVLKTIRNYATKSLQKVKIEQIEFTLLQLTSALKYENMCIDDSPLVKFLLEKVIQDPKRCQKFFWNVNIEVENDIKEVKEWYKQILGLFFETIKKSPNKILFQHISNQIQLRDILQQAFEKCISKRSNIVDATAKIHEFFEKKKSKDMQDILENDFFLFDRRKILTKFLPKNTKVFNSNTRPIRLTFLDSNQQEFKIMYKYGDDMRQDQLIMQMISLMDFLLKDLQVDPRLTIYDISVFSGSDGIMEFVDKAYTLQDVLDDYQDDLSKYLETKSTEITEKNPDQSPIYLQITNKAEQQLQNIRKDVFENYMDSCASYCVITYLLGIGDRHLENLLISDDGKIFHIDFGYAMGEDPKPYPPPFKMNKQMINVFAGNFRSRFISKCVAYYFLLRRNAKLILNLMYLMIDANLITNPNKKKKLNIQAIKDMSEKLILDKSEEEAEDFFKVIINQSVEAIATVIWDRIHFIKTKRWFQLIILNSYKGKLLPQQLFIFSNQLEIPILNCFNVLHQIRSIRFTKFIFYFVYFFNVQSIYNAVISLHFF